MRPAAAAVPPPSPKPPSPKASAAVAVAAAVAAPKVVPGVEPAGAVAEFVRAENKRVDCCTAFQLTPESDPPVSLENCQNTCLRTKGCVGFDFEKGSTTYPRCFGKTDRSTNDPDDFVLTAATWDHHALWEPEACDCASDCHQSYGSDEAPWCYVKSARACPTARPSATSPSDVRSASCRRRRRSRRRQEPPEAQELPDMCCRALPPTASRTAGVTPGVRLGRRHAVRGVPPSASAAWR